MKKIYSTVILLFIFLNSNSQTLTGINPNQGAVGTTLTAIITGQNTFFMSGSPQGIQTFFLGSYSLANYYCPFISGTNIQVLHEDSVSIDLTIPANLGNGTYDLYIRTGAGANVNLLSAFTVSGGTTYDLQSITPSVANEAQTFTGQITGQNLQTLHSFPGFIMKLHIGNDYYSTTGISVVNANTLSADFYIPTYTDTGSGSITVTSSVGCFILPGSLNVHGFYPKRLVSVQPSQAIAGNNLTALITGENTFFMSGSPQGVHSIQLKNQNCNIINGSNVQLVDEDHFNADFNIPVNASNGDYDVYVMLATGYSYTLPASFTILGGIDRSVQSFTPTSATAGTTVSATLDGSGIDDILNSLPVTITLVSTAGYQLTPTNINIVSSSQATMDFQIPIYVDNGFYELRITSAVGCYKIQQAVQVQGASPRGLISITPNQGLRGQVLTALVTGQYTFFMSGTFSNGVQLVRFTNSQNNNSYFDVTHANLSVVDSDHVSLNVNIPFWVSPGFYNIHLYQYSGTVYSLTPGFEISGTRISGNVYLDIDSNGVFNSPDYYLEGRRVLLLPDSIIAFTDHGGEFNFGVDSGQYTIEFYSDPNWGVTTTPNSYVLNIDSVDTLGLRFGINPVIDEYDLYITTIGDRPRCGNDVGYYITFKNFSTTTIEGLISFLPDSILSVTYTIPPVDFTNGDTLFWYYDSLSVFGSGTITVALHMPLAAGTHINSYSFITATDAVGGVLSSAIDSIHQIVRCSFDPNDKSVEPEGEQAANYTLNNQYLEYLIRFQNTGNDTAYQVIILDTLDVNLDPLTMQMIASTHPVEAHIQDHVVEFRFDNIMLPDSNIDEPMSHGYVKYRIKPFTSVPNGTTVYNNAGIYFDLNSPVITNTVFNTLVDHLPVGISQIHSSIKNLKIYPNPSTDKINVEFINASADNFRLRLFNINGTLLKSENSNGSSFKVEVSEYPQGMYFIYIENTESGDSYIGKVIIF